MAQTVSLSGISRWSLFETGKRTRNITKLSGRWGCVCLYVLVLGGLYRTGLVTWQQGSSEEQRERESWAYVKGDRFCPPPLLTNPLRPWACHRAPLRCQGDLFSHTGGMAPQQHACVGGCTWNAIIHYYLAVKPLTAAAKYKSKRNRLHESTKSYISSNTKTEGVTMFCSPSSMVRAVMDSLSAPWNSLKYGLTLIS